MKKLLLEQYRYSSLKHHPHLHYQCNHYPDTSVLSTFPTTPTLTPYLSHEPLRTTKYIAGLLCMSVTVSSHQWETHALMMTK
jgi:hypothetical protein